MKLVGRYFAIGLGSLLAGVLLHALLSNRHPVSQQPAAQAPALIVTQFQVGGPIFVGTQSTAGSLVIVTQVDLPLLANSPQSRSNGGAPNDLTPLEMEKLEKALKALPPPRPAVVEGGFLYDGILPQDFPRMNPPRQPKPPFAPVPPLPPPKELPR